MLHWYVMHSKPQKERWLYKQLNALEVDAYYPCLHINSGKLHSYTVKPYFPGYLFVNVDLALTGISILQWIPGSLGLVSFGGEPACVSEALLHQVRCRVDELNSAGYNVLNSLRPGDEVVIRSGPFAGCEAIFCDRLDDHERVQVLLKVLQDQRLKIDLSVDLIQATK